MFSYKSIDIPSINDMREARQTFDIGLIRDAANLLVKAVRQEIDVMAWFFPQDGYPDFATNAEDTEIEARTKTAPKDAEGTYSAPTVV